uniref:Uncharacterized protein n=1 Tax=Cannabis sativa TaxID=3483 RepID=A0A803PEH1_CANSA
MRHPTDSPTWKSIDARWHEFGNEPRNICLDLSADEIIPHTTLRSLSQPGNDIDVYLVPLVDYLSQLLYEDVPTYDTFRKEEFNRKAILVWTINDFPAFENLS